MANLAHTGFAEALVPQWWHNEPRVEQTVTFVCGPFPNGRMFVLVTPAGAESGEYFKVTANQRALMEVGIPPLRLSLEPYTEQEVSDEIEERGL